MYQGELGALDISNVDEDYSGVLLYSMVGITHVFYPMVVIIQCFSNDCCKHGNERLSDMKACTHTCDCQPIVFYSLGAVVLQYAASQFSTQLSALRALLNLVVASFSCTALVIEKVGEPCLMVLNYCLEAK